MEKTADQCEEKSQKTTIWEDIIKVSGDLKKVTAIVKAGSYSGIIKDDTNSKKRKFYTHEDNGEKRGNFSDKDDIHSNNG